VRSENWRYIRYHDGSEELYDETKDPLEWTNLAKDSRFSSIKADLAKWLPKVNNLLPKDARGPQADKATRDVKPPENEEGD